MKRSDFEIMAPVGSRESLAAAIKAGANSIYFGIGKLNMRRMVNGVDDLGYRAFLAKEFDPQSLGFIHGLELSQTLFCFFK